MTPPNSPASSPAGRLDESLLVEQARVLERIVRGHPLAGVLGDLCEIVERHAERPVRVAIALERGEPDAGEAGDPAWSTPVVSSTGTLLGTLAMWCAEPGAPAPAECRLAEVVARTAALAIERERADHTMRDLASRYHAIEERLAGMARAALTIHSSSSFSSALQVVTEEVRALVGADRAVTVIAADQAPSVCTVAFADPRRGRDERACDPAAVEAVMSRITGPVRLGRAELDGPPGWPDLLGAGGPGGPQRGVLAVPFVGRGGTRLGFVEICDKLEGEITAADEAIAIQLAQLAVVAIENTRLYDRLREQDRKKDEFLATLAHELRNPLAPIRTGLHVLQHEVSPEQAARTRDMMARQLVHLVRMVDDLLDISRVTLGKITLQRQRVDLRAILDSALETTRSLLDAGRHELVVRLPSHAVPLDVDPTRLAQAFGNLLNNAAKYTPPGGRIAITAELEAATVIVRVKDSGIGIPVEMLPYVFDMFTQVGRTIERAQGGLGIGLTLVRRLVEMHGGSVAAESLGPARGSTFVVRLPLAEVAEPSLATTADPARVAADLKILVVDDNVDAAEMLGMLLELRGYHTRLAHTGPAALDAAADFEPQVIFLDIGLPGLNGYQVAQRLRASGRQPQPVLVALTGWGTEEDRRQAKDAGFDGHLVKPVDIRQLEATLGELRRPPS